MYIYKQYTNKIQNLHMEVLLAGILLKALWKDTSNAIHDAFPNSGVLFACFLPMCQVFLCLNLTNVILSGKLALNIAIVQQQQ